MNRLDNCAVHRIKHNAEENKLAYDHYYYPGYQKNVAHRHQKYFRIVLICCCTIFEQLKESNVSPDKNCEQRNVLDNPRYNRVAKIRVRRFAK